MKKIIITIAITILMSACVSTKSPQEHTQEINEPTTADSTTESEQTPSIQAHISKGKAPQKTSEETTVSTTASLEVIDAFYKKVSAGPYLTDFELPNLSELEAGVRYELSITANRSMWNSKLYLYIKKPTKDGYYLLPYTSFTPDDSQIFSTEGYSAGDTVEYFFLLKLRGEAEYKMFGLGSPENNLAPLSFTIIEENPATTPPDITDANLPPQAPAEPKGSVNGEWVYKIIPAADITAAASFSSLTETRTKINGLPLLECMKPEDGLHIALYAEDHMRTWEVALYIETPDKKGYYEIDLSGPEYRRYRYLDTSEYSMDQEIKFFYLIYKPESDYFLQHGLNGEDAPLSFTIGKADERISLDNYFDFLELYDLPDYQAGKSIQILIKSKKPLVDWEITLYCDLIPDRSFTFKERYGTYSILLPVSTKDLAGTEVTYRFRIKNLHYGSLQFPEKTFMITEP